ncbi:hypothetical protein, partial [Azotobacter vinelandii]|uniref:hypothetical protein n=1 Tax=Azotobacter vinelandii TaxID=354 RepID=UPI001E361A76
RHSQYPWHIHDFVCHNRHQNQKKKPLDCNGENKPPERNFSNSGFRTIFSALPALVMETRGSHSNLTLFVRRQSKKESREKDSKICREG